MLVELILGLVIVSVLAIWFFNRDAGLDVNNDGKVDLADAKAAVNNTVQGIKAAADLDNSGNVGFDDLKVVTDAVKSTAKGAVAEAKRTVTRAKNESKRKKAVKAGDLNAMKKNELLEYAKTVKATVNTNMTKAKIIDAINAVEK